MNTLSRRLVLASILVSILTACSSGGGSSVAGGGVSGTGVTSGVITGFGSVLINGFELDISGAEIIVDDEAGKSQDDLAVGMLATATVTFNADDKTGTVMTLVADDDLEGPVSSVIANADGTRKTLEVLGQAVIVVKGETVFDNTPAGFNFDTIAVNDVVEIRGFVDNGVLRATHIENKGVFDPLNPANTAVELKGTVDSFNNGNTFNIGPVTVTFDPTGVATDLGDLPGGVVNGLFVEVHGNVTNLAALQVFASKIEPEAQGFGDDIEKISVEGIIKTLMDQDNFVLSTDKGEVTVLVLPGASREPVGLQLAEGMQIEVEGAIVNNVLQALEVETRDGDIKIAATISAKTGSGKNGSLTLKITPSASLDVTINEQTLMEDGTGAPDPTPPSFDLDDLSFGDFVELRAFKDGTGAIVALRLKRDDLDDVILQASKSDFSFSSGTITFGSVSFQTITGITQFEDEDDNQINPNTLTQFLTLNCAMVKIKDKDDVPVGSLIDGLGDGTADEVDCEN